MKALKTIAAAALIASSLSLAPVAANAQSSGPASAASSFDSYRVLAVTAGVIVGATAAAIVTDGLIIPAYAYVAGGTGAAGGAAMGTSLGNIGPTVYHTGYNLVRGGMRVLGAVGGGFYADAWYTGR
jgi:hypothetical protein